MTAEEEATASGPGPIEVLVVASWFPSVEDPADGPFVADQAEALAATGVARVAVVTFDPARLSGGPKSRGHEASAVLEGTRGAIRAAAPLFEAPVWGVDPSLPVARLSIPEGTTTAAGQAHMAAHRQAALETLGDRLAGEGATGWRGIVHAHTVYPDGAASIGLAERLGWPLVVTEHSSFVPKLVAEPAIRERYAATMARAHRIIAVSEMLASELRSTFPEHADRVVVIPNAVQLEHFRVTPSAERAVDELLFVGHRKPSKGIEVLLRAVAIAPGRSADDHAAAHRPVARRGHRGQLARPGVEPGSGGRRELRGSSGSRGNRRCHGPGQPLRPPQPSGDVRRRRRRSIGIGSAGGRDQFGRGLGDSLAGPRSAGSGRARR